MPQVDEIDLTFSSGETVQVPTLKPVLEVLQGLTDAIKLQIILAGGENHIGSVGGNSSFVDVTLTLDTAAYASGDVLADTQPIAAAMRVNDAKGILQSIIVIDEDDQGVAFDLVFLSVNSTIGTENAAVSITDVNARELLGIVAIEATDFVDLGGSRLATKHGLGLVVKPATGTRIIYVAAIARGAATYTTAGLKLRLGFLQD